MKLSREKLVGWLVFLGHQDDDAGKLSIPTEAIDGIVGEGWAATRTDEIGVERMTLTEKGQAVWDVESLEWGIDPLLVEER